ncbi:D-2-hydroxyacid dehydrogenase [Prevotella sp.]|uniref:D-2-hydroxyacid dehydrogenase n=1 Tax=uncultured Prevotella sp. TaxID=159272 RepID=UPI0025CC8DF2|nr:D-2-hydroxyacid dehydrogenase [Prevotella sp.]MCI7119254.1 D-2-hydroxyacid dehydrogenase [Prevotella sp.]
MKIVVMDGKGVNPGDMSWKQIQQFGELIVYERTASEEIIDHVGDAEIVLTNKTVFDEDTIAKLKNVKYIGVLATGYNVVDLKAASKRGIVVTNIPAYSTDSVAQMTFAHILNVTNHVDHYARASRDGEWSRCPDFCYWDKPLVELAGKTIGIIGLGNIGMKVANIALNFGMNVIAYTSKEPKELPNGINKASIDNILSDSDIISLHCPLTKQTRELINKDSIAKMKRSVIVVNTGRGPLVNEEDVANALHNGLIGAYCADVMCSEPPSADNPLFVEQNAYITPHVAWASKEARIRLMDIAEKNIHSFLSGKPINVVNI